MGGQLTGRIITTHNNSLANLCRGVGERVLYTNRALVKPISPKDKVFEERLHRYRDQLVSLVGYASPVTPHEFVGFYKGPRAKLYQRAVDELQLLGARPRDAYLKTFVKAEKIVVGLKHDPVPRVIQPRNPRYNVGIGRYLRPIEKHIYRSIDTLFGHPTIMSEYNAYTQAKVLREKWEFFSRPVCVGLDASRFDQHVSKQALQFEHSIYAKIFKSNELNALLKLQLDNAGIAVASDGHFRYRVKGSRMSGDMNTSLGNKILMTLMCKSFMDYSGIPMQLANNGDDCLLFLDRKHLRKLDDLHRYFEDFGFKIVSEPPVFDFEKIEFCQTKPILSNGIWRMMRNVKTCLAKDMSCINLGWRTDEFRHWLYDVGNCGESIASDVPVLGVFYKQLKTIGVTGNYQAKNDTDYKWYWRMSHNAKSRHSEPDATGRYSFWLSTGISPDEQVAIENELKLLTWGDDMRQRITAIYYLLK